MRRAVTGIAICVLIGACALMDPVPPGTRPVQISVRNNAGRPVSVRVTTPAGVIPGSAVPSVVPSGPGTLVTINVPVDREWTLELEPGGPIGGNEFDDYTANGCMFGVELLADGGYSYGCANEL